VKRGCWVLMLLFVPATTAAQRELPGALPAGRVAPLRLVPWSAGLENGPARPDTLAIGGVRWICRSDSCAAMAPAARPRVAECRLLAEKAGRVTSYGHAGAKLDAEAINACNAPAPSIGSAGMIAKVDPRIPGRGPVVSPGVPELAIVDVRRVGPADPVRVGDVVPVQVLVRNDGRGPARIQVGTPADPGRGEGLMRYSRMLEIRPGSTATFPLDLHATGNRFRGDRYETDIFLFDRSRQAEGPLLPVFTDSDPSDNQWRVSLPFAAPLATRADDECPYGTFGCNRCVADVPATFGHASGSGDLRHPFSFDPASRARNGPTPDAFSVYDHIQGIARLPGLGSENLLALSRNARDPGDAAIYIVAFDGIVSHGDAWKWAVSRRTDEARSYWYYRIPGANHAGGMQALGGLLFVAADCDEGNHCDAFVQIYDVRDPGNARVLGRLVIDGSRGELLVNARRVSSRAAAVGAIRQADGRVLMFVRGRWDDEAERFNGWFFRSSEAVIDEDTRWEYVDGWDNSEMTGGEPRNPWESVQLIGECGTGHIYMIAMGADDNTSFLYRLTERLVAGGRSSELGFEHVRGRGLNPGGIGLTASTRYGGGVHVTPNGQIVSYITDRQPTVGIDEFRYHGPHGD